MATLVKLTDLYLDSVVVVNLDNISTITPYDQGSFLIYRDTNIGFNVNESPDQIYTLAQSAGVVGVLREIEMKLYNFEGSTVADLLSAIAQGR